MAAAPSDGCPVQVPINVLTTKSTLSHFGERQTFLAQMGLLFSVYLQSLPSPPLPLVVESRGAASIEINHVLGIQ